MKHALRNALGRPWRSIRRIAGRDSTDWTPRELPDALYCDRRDPVILMDLTTATSSYFYTFGPDGWSPFQGAASILLEGGSRQDVRDCLSTFYDGFQPRSLAEACFGPGAAFEPLSTLSPFDGFKPWRQSIRKISGHDGSGNQNFGPVSENRLDIETDRIVETCRSLQKHGYEPESFADGFILGYALADGPRLTFAITSGVHRAAILSAMGATHAKAKFNPRMPRVIEKASLPLWPHVRSGLCSRAAASEIFDRQMQPGHDARRDFLPG